MLQGLAVRMAFCSIWDFALKSEPRIWEFLFVALFLTRNSPLTSFQWTQNTAVPHGVKYGDEVVHCFYILVETYRSDAPNAVALKRFIPPRRRCMSTGEIFMQIGAKVQHLTADERIKRMKARNSCILMLHNDTNEDISVPAVRYGDASSKRTKSWEDMRYVGISRRKE